MCECASILYLLKRFYFKENIVVQQYYNEYDKLNNYKQTIEISNIKIQNHTIKTEQIISGNQKRDTANETKGKL